jgi:hypothetical protein
MIINCKSTFLLFGLTLFSTLSFANYTPLTQWVKVNAIDFDKVAYYINNMDYSFIDKKNYYKYLRLSTTPFPYNKISEVEGIQGTLTMVIVRKIFEKNGSLKTFEQTYHTTMDGPENCSGNIDITVKENRDPSQGYVMNVVNVN